MNWTPATLLDARWSRIVDPGGAVLTCGLYPDGWEIRAGGAVLTTGADVWTACRVLNDRGAVVADGSVS